MTKVDYGLMRDFCRYAGDLLRSPTVRSMRGFVQHGKISCYQHSVMVAFFSLALVRRLGMRCDERSLVRGGLLHDYFLYDWHKKETWHRWHGFRHAAVALRNAQRDFPLNPLEKRIIRRHMWPLGGPPPLHREEIIVNLVDTFCAVWEMAKR